MASSSAAPSAPGVISKVYRLIRGDTESGADARTRAAMAAAVAIAEKRDNSDDAAQWVNRYMVGAFPGTDELPDCSSN